MLLFPAGITIKRTEHECLEHLEAFPEGWLADTVREKAALRRAALFREWLPRLRADPAVEVIPATSDGLLALIVGRPEYKTRAESDAAMVPPEAPGRRNVARFQGDARPAPTVTLFSGGFDLPDGDVTCILAYIQDLDDWVLGALLGHINRGRKKLFREWEPKLLDDPEVLEYPGDDDGLVGMIVGRPDYKNRTARDEEAEAAQKPPAPPA